jgi:RNA polymerase sigma-70 factor (ECF subfamily)
MQDIESIYKKYFEYVYKYLFCLTHNADISEELTQETFCKVVKEINNFKGDCKTSTWLCQIAKNLWYNEYKKNKNTITTTENDFLAIQSLDCIEDKIISDEEKVFLHKEIQKLDEQTKEVIYLRITEEFSFKEIAAILGKTENWARIIFYRGKQALLKEVDKYESKK